MADGAVGGGAAVSPATAGGLTRRLGLGRAVERPQAQHQEGEGESKQEVTIHRLPPRAPGRSRRAGKDGSVPRVAQRASSLARDRAARSPRWRRRSRSAGSGRRARGAARGRVDRRGSWRLAPSSQPPSSGRPRLEEPRELRRHLAATESGCTLARDHDDIGPSRQEMPLGAERGADTRFTRVRTTDPPTLRLAVTPRRGRSPASSRPRRGPRPSSTRKFRDARRSPSRERRSKSRRLRKRSRRENRRSPAESATGLLGGDRDDQALPTLGASALQDCPAVLRRHARPKAVAATALQPARLIRSLHGECPASPLAAAKPDGAPGGQGRSPARGRTLPDGGRRATSAPW